MKYLKEFDVAGVLKTPEDIRIFLEDAFEANDAGYIAHALGVVARAEGMSKIAKQTGLSREQLSDSLNKAGNLQLKTFLSVMNTLGLKLTATERETT